VSPYSLLRPASAAGDIARAGGDALPRAHQDAQAGAPALSDLAVLLEGPAEVPAVFGASDAGYLMGQYRPLIPGEAGRDLEQPLQIHAPYHQLVHFGPGVANLHVDIPRAAEWERILERGLQGTAPTQRAPPVSDPRYETLLERICEVSLAGEPPSSAHRGEQLERRLAKAFLEILDAQLVAMGAQQRAPLGEGDERQLLGRVDTPATGPGGRAGASRHGGARRRARALGAHAETRVWLSLRRWGTHAGMSLARIPRPPSQLR
jgi:hypothetical protein